MTIIVGRAHSGTRLIPQALHDAGVFIGSPLNIACDLIPAESIYEACKIFGHHVKYNGKNEWDFSNTHTEEIPNIFKELLAQYLKSIIDADNQKKAWKIPNNTFIYPWLVRLLPNAKYLFWIRHPEGSCSKLTGVDRLEKWNIPCKKFWFHEFNYKMRLISWKYHYDIVMQTPPPKHFLKIRYEDYILNQEKTKGLVENFTGVKIKSYELDKTKAGPFKKHLGKKYSFLRKAMDACGYE